MHSRHTQAIVFIAIILAACNSLAQSSLGGLLNSIKNTSGYTIYQGQVVIADSTDVSLVPPFWMRNASVTTTTTAYACSLDVGRIDLGTNVLWGGPDSFSIEYWIKPNTLSPAKQAVYGEDNRVDCGFAHDSLWFRTYNPTDGFKNLVSSSVTCTIGVWSHIIMSFRNNYNMVIYKNGVATDSVTAFTSPAYYINLATFIGYGTYDNFIYQGCVDEFRAYNMPLSQDTITVHYNGGAGQYGSQQASMIGAYHLDDGTGTNADDYGPNGFDGTLINTVSWVVGKVAGPTSTVGGSLPYTIGTVYNDSILNGAYGFMTSSGRGYVAVKNGKTRSVIPGNRVLVTCDSVGLADCDRKETVPDHFLEIGQPITKFIGKNAHGDSICIADIHKL